MSLNLRKFKNMSFKTIIISILIITAVVQLSSKACTMDGADCQYSYECCSGACSAAFKYCLHR
ncbi:conotoxin like 2 protein [Lonomia obliqua multiple nucleopolyhedrovirus]|uniref:Conotoxin like 2 protein n=1 Tax=Lonomia obliqua multiple nucleopolyhedrovirus TaxID=134394 RepID=A0A126FC80_9ABAC|nr:conotoxin like 2 protein [Lonomia obliqua multiple nucleopolyhedrovirus]AKN81004.1 conotoxin like 2 protein [Lonomia obliqua multiple nucleopolyhedrovirus]